MEKNMENNSHIYHQQLQQQLQKQQKHTLRSSKGNGLTNTAKGLSILRSDSGNHQRIDFTEGIGAFLDIMHLMAPGTKNLDIGGGRFDDTTLFLSKFSISNFVTDPFQRSEAHNEAVLAFGQQIGGFDSVSIMSVLNVIEKRTDRMKLLQLAHKYLRKQGHLFIKIWKGVGDKDRFQMNEDVTFYLDEVKSVFPNAICIATSNLIYARRQ